jgi:Zn-dependent protease
MSESNQQQMPDDQNQSPAAAAEYANPTPASPPRKKRRGGIWTVLAIVGVILAKLKYLLVALKLGKFGGTIISMVVMIAVYATQFGWMYAAGFVVLIAIHESGHVLAARRAGLKTTMPVFIPFVGAFIAMKQQPTDAKTEAIIAAGGPVLGSIAAFACLALGLEFDNRLLLALAYTGCLLNLFNLIPVSPLDGGRIVTAISPYMWLIGIPILIIVAVKYPNPFTIILVILGAFQAYRMWRSPDKRYFAVTPRTRTTFAVLYFGLMITLGAVMAYIHSLHAPASTL